MTTEIQFRLDPEQVYLLISAAQFVIKPETMPIFKCWLDRNTDPCKIPPADEIPHDLAEISINLTAWLLHQTHTDGARATGERVP